MKKDKKFSRLRITLSHVLTSDAKWMVDGGGGVVGKGLDLRKKWNLL